MKRRLFIAGIVSGTAVGGYLLVTRFFPGHQDPVRAFVLPLQSMFPDDARRLGSRALPILGEPSHAQILHRLFSGAAWDHATNENSLALFSKQVSHDFQEGRVHQFKRWMLSESELLMYALIAY